MSSPASVLVSCASLACLVAEVAPCDPDLLRFAFVEEWSEGGWRFGWQHHHLITAEGIADYPCGEAVGLDAR